MLLSITTRPIDQKFSYKNAISIIKTAGFDAFDISLTNLNHLSNNIFNCDNYISIANDLRMYADNLGIICNQAHAPAPSSCKIPEENEKIFEIITRSMEISAILGAKIIVVHPKQHLTYAENIDKLFELNMDFYNRLIPYCEKFGIKIAVENMWQYIPNTHTITHSTCSRSFEFKKYLDTINSNWITGCLDLGHIALVEQNIPSFIKELGKNRIGALHIHDNFLKEDNHLLPYNGLMDYNSIAKVLGEIDYQGDITFEAHNSFKNLPNNLLPSAYNYACSVGRHLINLVEESRK